MAQISDHVPLNAGVKVDYKTRKVFFSYPLKSKGWLRNTLDFIYPNFLMIYWIVCLAIGILGFVSAITYGVLKAVFYPVVVAAPTQAISDAASLALVKLGLTVLLLFLPPFFPSLWYGFHYKRFSHQFPKILHELYSLIGRPNRRVVLTELERDYYELPVFRNVFLGYDTGGDFARFLKCVEVRPLDFKIVKKVKGVETMVAHDDQWKAVFSFSQVPKRGFLKIDFM